MIDEHSAHNVSGFQAATFGGTGGQPAAARPANPEDRPFRRHGPAQGIPDYSRQLLDRAMPVQAPPPPEEEAEPADLSAADRPLRSLLNVALVLALVVGLFALAQAATLFNQIAALPTPVRPVAYALLIAVLGVLVWFGLKFAWSYARLRVSPTLDLKMQHDLRMRDRARQELAEAHAGEARQILAVLLHEYPAGIRAQRKTGLQPTEIDAVVNARRHLAGPSAPSDHAKWLASYESEFLETLDRAADRHVSRHLKRVFALTATVPRGGLDTVIVLCMSYQMVADLCRLYNVRAGRWGSAVILAHLLVNVMAAGEVHDATASAAGSLGDMAHQHLSQATAAVLGAGAKVIGKAAEGGVNSILLWRLSLRTRDYLRPIRKSA
jgi:putative membrane protein